MVTEKSGRDSEILEDDSVRMRKINERSRADWYVWPGYVTPLPSDDPCRGVGD